MADGTILLTVVWNPRTDTHSRIWQQLSQKSEQMGIIGTGNYSSSHNTNNRPCHLYLVGLQTNYKPHLMPGSSSVKNLNRLPYNLNPLSGLLQNNVVEGQEFNSCLPDNELENFSMFSQPTALSLESLVYYLLDFPQETQSDLGYFLQLITVEQTCACSPSSSCEWSLIWAWYLVWRLPWLPDNRAVSGRCIGGPSRLLQLAKIS